MYYSQFQTQIEQGKKAEQTYKRLAESKGYKVKASTTKANKRKHIDFIVTVPAKDDQPEYKVTVDVKSVGYRGHTAEIRNNLGYPGSLFGSQDIIAYVDTFEILSIWRTDLIDLLQQKEVLLYDDQGNRCYKSIITILPEMDHDSYQVYTRPEWRDLWCIVDREDLRKIAIGQWSIN